MIGWYLAAALVRWSRLQKLPLDSGSDTDLRHPYPPKSEALSRHRGTPTTKIAPRPA